jgi:hypothetical protein
MPSYVNIEDLQTGMKLAEDLSNKFGQVLAKSGAEIKEVHLKMLKTWSIDGVLIMDENDTEIELKPEEKAIYMKKVASMMKFTPNTKIEKNLCEGILFHLLKHNKLEINR